MSTRWKNLYPGKNSGVHIASDNPADICQLVELLLETVGDIDSRITRPGALEALAIAESLLSSLGNPGKDHDMHRDDDYQDINSKRFKTDTGWKSFWR